MKSKFEPKHDIKLGLTVHTCNPSTLETEATGSEAQVYLFLHTWTAWDISSIIENLTGRSNRITVTFSLGYTWKYSWLNSVIKKLYVCSHMHALRDIYECQMTAYRGWFCLSCSSLGWSSGPQAGWKVALPGEPSYQCNDLFSAFLSSIISCRFNFYCKLITVIAVKISARKVDGFYQNSWFLIP